MKIYNNITELIGDTPILKLNRFMYDNHLKSNLYAKLECFNPGGSIKDRIALAMILDAEENGLLNKDSIIVEPTSGNTGIGIAMVAKAKGYQAILVMPETMSEERKKLLKAYHATLVLTNGKEGMAGAVNKANEIVNNTPNAIILKQFENPVNPRIHEKTTANEIWNAIQNIDYLICGIGTGGTISGVGKFLKEKNPKIKVIGVEPSASPMITKGISGPHKIQGIGANFIPKILNQTVIDEMICITDDEAIKFSNLLTKSEGFLVGISSGAILSAATKIANKYENKHIVMILPDNGERYLSTSLYEELK